jgi:outer membrane protein assembly factor BamB
MAARPHPSDCLFCTAGNHLVSVELATGTEVWRTRIPNGGTSIASILVRDGCVVVACAGRMHCFDAASGTHLWTNELKGLGYGAVFVGPSSGAQAAAVRAAAAAVAAVAASG